MSTSSYHRAFDAVDELAPGNPPELTALYTLLALTTGEATSLEDVHEAWAMWTVAHRPERQDHPSLVPFAELTREIQELDTPYRDAIRAAARALTETATPLLHEPETVTVLDGRCAQEVCDHDSSPSDECQWREIQVCSACSYEGVDLGTADRVAVTPWPCDHAAVSA